MNKSYLGGVNLRRPWREAQEGKEEREMSESNPAGWTAKWRNYHISPKK
jgi:hypothetical protein